MIKVHLELVQSIDTCIIQLAINNTVLYFAKSIRIHCMTHPKQRTKIRPECNNIQTFFVDNTLNFDFV